METTTALYTLLGFGFVFGAKFIIAKVTQKRASKTCPQSKQQIQARDLKDQLNAHSIERNNYHIPL